MQREFPTDPSTFRDPRDYQPFTPIEALMLAVGTDEPKLSTIELLAIREAIVDAIDTQLNGLETWVFNALFVERKSLRRLARELSIPKTTIARIRDRATAKLRETLETVPLIQEYLER